VSILVDQTTTPVNLVWMCGDSAGQAFRFLAAPDTPMDLSAITVSADARGTLGDITALTVTVDDPSSGVVHISDPGLAPDVYDYDIEFDYGATVATWIRGRIQIRKDVTS
jgi:hypothetical protein